MHTQILVTHPFKHHALNLAAGCAQSGLSTALALPFYRKGVGTLISHAPGPVGRKAAGYSHPALRDTNIVQSSLWQLRKLWSLLRDPDRIAAQYDAYVASKLLSKRWQPELVVTLQDYMPRTSVAAKRIGALLWSDQILNLSDEATDRIAAHTRACGAGVVEAHSETANNEILSIADIVTVPSAYMRQCIRGRVGAATRVHSIPYGVDTSRFSTSRGADPDTFTVVARANTLRKGGHLVLAAILRSHASWARLVQPKKLRIVFLGACEPALAELLAKVRRLPDADVHDGNIPNRDVPALLAGADLFLMPTLSEGMSLASVEAMCAGVPLVITRFSGVDCFVDGEMGVLVEDNVESVERGVSRALADHVQRQRWSSNARAAAMRLSWGRYEQQIATLAGEAGV